MFFYASDLLVLLLVSCASSLAAGVSFFVECRHLYDIQEVIAAIYQQKVVRKN
jgi:hypothetical protein